MKQVYQGVSPKEVKDVSTKTTYQHINALVKCHKYLIVLNMHC